VAVGKATFADQGFADCSLPTATWLCGRQSLCRLGLSLCRPGQAVGKEAFSCSDGRRDRNYYYYYWLIDSQVHRLCQRVPEESDHRSFCMKWQIIRRPGPIDP
jgi:hypothetical protein